MIEREGEGMTENGRKRKGREGRRKRKKMEKIPPCGKAIGHYSLRGRCPKGWKEVTEDRKTTEGRKEDRKRVERSRKTEDIRMTKRGKCEG